MSFRPSSFALSPFLLALTALADPLPTGIPALRVPDAVGVNIHFTGAPKRDLDLIAAAGFGFVRMDFGWEAVERKKGEYSFTAYDTLISGLAERKIRAVFILDYGNKLYDGGLPPHSDEGRAAYARFAAAAARHYKDFPNGRSILWEIWNEPNITQFWKPKPNADDYAAMALAACKAMRAADPQSTIIAPATSEIDLKFLEAVFAKGLLAQLDAVSVHPYRGSNPETAAGDYAKLRALIVKYSLAKNAKGAKKLPIISGEWGYSTNTRGVSRDKQAQYLARQWLTNLANGVPLSIWYDWHDDGPDPKENEHNFGTVTFKEYDFKPSYFAALRTIESLHGYTFIKRLPQESHDDHVLLFTRADKQCLAAWTTGQEHEITFPIRGGCITRRTDEAIVRELLAASELRINLSPTPQFISWKDRDERMALEAAWRIVVETPLVRADSRARDADAPRFKVTIENPFSIPISGTLRAKGENGWERFGSFQLKASQIASYEWRGSITRLDVEYFVVPVELLIDAPRFTLSQSVVFTVANAIQLRAAPAADANGNLEVRIFASNPSGESLRGEIEWSAGHALVRTAPVTFKQGQQEAVVSIATGLSLPREDPLRFDYWLWKPRPQELAELETIHDETIQVIEDFSGDAVQRYQALLDGDAKAAGKISMRGYVWPKFNTKFLQEAGGFNSSALVEWEFGDGWRFWRLVPRTPLAIEGKPKALGVWVYYTAQSPVSGKGDPIRCRFFDSTGQTFQPTAELTLGEFAGWRYVTMPLADTSAMGHWGGANDGVIHYPIKFDTLFLVDSESRKAHADAIYVTGFTLHY